LIEKGGVGQSKMRMNENEKGGRGSGEERSKQNKGDDLLGWWVLSSVAKRKKKALALREN